MRRRKQEEPGGAELAGKESTCLSFASIVVYRVLLLESW